MENKGLWRAALSHCRFPNAAAALVESFGGGVIPEPLAKALDTFCTDPRFETAWALILSQPQSSQSLAELFIGFCGGPVPVERTYSITREPEFEAMCEAVGTDLVEYRRLRQALKFKGYTETELNVSFAKYWAERPNNAVADSSVVAAPPPRR